MSLAMGLVLIAAVAIGVPGFAIEKPNELGKFSRDFDAREALSGGLTSDPSGAQLRAEAALRASVPELSVRYATTGAARTVSNHVGYLTGPSLTEATPLEIGLAFVRDHGDLFGLTAADLDDYEITDVVPSRSSGASHIYLRQVHDGISVYLGQLHFNVDREGRLLSVNNAFLPNLAAAVNSRVPSISAADAVSRVLRELGFDADPPRNLSSPRGADQRHQLDATGLSRSPIEARLMWLPITAGQARLVWNFQLETVDGMHWFDLTVDAVTGQVWTRFDWIDDASYNVYPFNIESPNHTSPLPPADARVVLVDPHNVAASPFGWHDTDGDATPNFTIHRGNNTHTWEDSDGNDTPPAAGTEPDCGGGLVCNFPIDLNNAPSTYRPGAVSNLFYWTNVIHDVIYQYGFDEPGGNFQVFNYDGMGGLPGDDVQALAQAAGNCNANFGTPPDGSRPRMRMFNCTNTTPARDGDLDHGVIWHEYGHGISNRLVGGPATTSCLGNSQQPGEGWSDWYGLATTTQVGQLGTTLKGMGTYLFGQPPTGPGIRPQPYSTDNAINTYTYSSIAGLSVPHGVGSVWAQAIWEVYWALIDEHGFDPDFYDGAGTAGNQRAMLYVTEGLKETACGPSFLDTRDGIIQAAVDNHGGEDVCLIWEAFAAFGLGTDASTPGPGSTTATNGFAIPTSCSFLGAPAETVDICAGNDANYTVTAGNAFTPPVDLAAVGLPGATTALFGTDPIPSVPGSSTLAIQNTGALAAGPYSFTVEGTDAVPQTQSLALDMNVFVGTPAAPALTSPADGTTGAPLRPTLVWAAAAGAASYTVDVATDAGFTSIVYTATVTGTSHVVATNLAANTDYFWRVTATNPCGTGTASGTFDFTTVNLICASPALAIPDNIPAGVTNDMVVSSSGNLTDLDVVIRATHTFVGDLIFTITNVTTATSVVVFDRPGRTTSGFGCGGNDIDTTLDDEAANPVESQCGAGVPTILGTFSPNNPLSAFDGQNLAGTWRITASDNAGADLGTLTEWCLAPAGNLTSALFSDGFESGNTSAWSATVPP